MHSVKAAWFPGTSSGIHSWTNSKKSFLKDYGQEGYDRCETTRQNQGEILSPIIRVAVGGIQGTD